MDLPVEAFSPRELKPFLNAKPPGGSAIPDLCVGRFPTSGLNASLSLSYSYPHSDAGISFVRLLVFARKPCAWFGLALASKNG